MKYFSLKSYKNKEQRILIIVAFVLFIYTILRGIQLPDDWAKTFWLINYDFGFIKRGLPGAIFSFFFDYKSVNIEQNIIYVSFGIFIILSILMWILVSLFIKFFRFSLYDILILFVFISSKYIVMSARLMGYYDHLIFIFLLIALIFNHRKKHFFASIILTTSIFIHESALIVCFPLLVFQFLLIYYKLSFWKQILKILCFCTLPIIAFLIILANNTWSSYPTNSLENHLFDYSSFISIGTLTLVSESITNRFFQFVYDEHVYFFSRIFNRCIILIGFPLVLILYYNIPSRKGKSNQNINLYILYFFMSISPLILHLIAWDTERIWSYTLIVAFLGSVLLRYYNKFNNTFNKKWFFLATISCLIINIITRIPLARLNTENFHSFYNFSILSIVLISIYLIYKNEIKTIFHKSIEP